MADDLVGRLRAAADRHRHGPKPRRDGVLLAEAADEIEALRAERDNRYTAWSRYDTAVQALLDSGVLVERQTDAFWAFVDSNITEDELRDHIR